VNHLQSPTDRLWHYQKDYNNLYGHRVFLQHWVKFQKRHVAIHKLLLYAHVTHLRQRDFRPLTEQHKHEEYGMSMMDFHHLTDLHRQNPTGTRLQPAIY